MWIQIVRTIKTGWQNFVRNKWLSAATISVLLIAIFVITVQFAVTIADNLLLKEVQNRVSISVYFKPDIEGKKIQNIKESLEKYKEIESIEYISKDKALADFERRTQNSEILQETLKELDANPFEDTLNIKAHDPSQYEVIANSVENGQYSEYISSVNYYKYRDVIDGLSSSIKASQRIAVLLGITLSAIAILITFNSVMITIYSYRKEIEIMRLVGASKNYIRMPFIWEGVMFGIIAGILATPLSYVYLKFISTSDSTGAVLPFSNSVYIQQFLNEYFIQYLWLVVLIQIGAGIVLGIISSWIATRKYLKENK